MDFNNILFKFAMAMGALCIFAALLVFAASKFSDTQGGIAEGRLVAFVLAAIASFGAGAYILAADLTIG